MRNPTTGIRFLSTRLSIGWDKKLHTELRRVYENKKSPLRILDLGAGPAKYWTHGVLKEFLIESNSSLELIDATTVFDSSEFPSGINVVRIKGIIPEILTGLETDNYDIVIAIDLIEHLPKNLGYLMLYEIDRIAKFSQVLVTPNGFAWQPPSLNNPYNAHVSGWTPSELKKLGYRKTRGQNGSKFSFGPYGLPKNNSTNFLMLEFLALDRILFYLIPKLSFSFIAIKRKKNVRIIFHG